MPDDERKAPSALDRLVGRRIQMRRQQASMSRADLASHIGISFQQLAKYENGQNRITVGRLANIASILDAPLAFFFVGLSYPLDQALVPLGQGPEDAREIEGLLGGFIGISSPAVRREVIEMVAALAQYSEDSSKWN